MKKVFFVFFILIVIAVNNNAFAARMYGCTSLTGGGTGALDALDITASSTPNSNNLANGDTAIVISDSYIYFYYFNSGATTSESSPDYIRPDDYTTTGVWERAIPSGYDHAVNAAAPADPVNGGIYISSNGVGQDWTGWNINGTTSYFVQYLNSAYWLWPNDNPRLITGAPAVLNAAPPSHKQNMYYWCDADGTYDPDTEVTGTDLYKIYDNGSSYISIMKEDGTILSSTYHTKCLLIIGATASSDYMAAQLPYAVTIRTVRVTQRGATNVVGHFDECDSAGASCAGVDGATDITATTTQTDDGSLSNGTIDANDVIQWHTTSVSGTNTDCLVCINYTIDN